MESYIDNEIWRPVKGYEGLYQVSNLGRFKSLAHSTVSKNGTLKKFGEKILSPSLSNNGYVRPVLMNGVVKKYYKGHRLVAQAFLGDIDGFDINHKDGNKQNNVVSNLEIVTRKENINHAYKNKLTSANKYNDAQRRIVEKYSLDDKFICEYYGVREAARQNGVSSTAIQHCCVGVLKTVKGSKFKYR